MQTLGTDTIDDMASLLKDAGFDAKSVIQGLFDTGFKDDAIIALRKVGFSATHIGQACHELWGYGGDTIADILKKADFCADDVCTACRAIWSGESAKTISKWLVSAGFNHNEVCGALSTVFNIAWHVAGSIVDDAEGLGKDIVHGLSDAGKAIGHTLSELF